MKKKQIQDVSNEITPNLFKNLNQRSKYFFVYVHHFNPALHKSMISFHLVFENCLIFLKKFLKFLIYRSG